MQFSVDASLIDRALEWLPEKMVRPAARMALNDTGRQATTAAKGKIRERYNITAGLLNQRVWIGYFASNQNLQLEIASAGRSIDLTYFGARWVRGNRVVTRTSTKTFKRARGTAGVFYEAERGKPGHLPNAFIARVEAGKSGGSHMGVFVRKGDTRLKIVNKNMISVASMFDRDDVQEAIRRVVDEKFPERFSHHIERLKAL